MKRTPLYEIHKSLGAKLVEFGGFEMPVQYTGIIEEHLVVRKKVGVFDVSHMGEFEVRGKDALSFLQKTTVNDVSKLHEGRVQYSAMCYENGGIVDDLLVYHCGDHYMLVVNASNTQKDFDWLQSHVSGDVDLKDKSDSFALLAVQGPKSLQTLQKLTSVDLSKIEYYHFTRGTVAGVPMIISRTGYTGEMGFELYLESNAATCSTIWQVIFDAGKEYGIAPIGLGARDTLRLEMGFCLYGNDIDQTTHPLEAGLGWITKLNKGDFLGKPALVKAKEEGLKRRLVGFTLKEKAFPRHGYELKSNSTSIGQVTSGTFSPSLEYGIGMGYVSAAFSEPGSSIEIVIRGKGIPAQVVKLPFVQKS
ncbi:MAG: glycine cleavage system aminomethyltransferase GcvT [Ignavibacteriales bacterium]|nr:glycine cleavage system aminomethyltransferase GcvT [Ignavibacteriales bacterium]